MRPLAIDLAAFFLPLAVGVGLFLAGRPFRHWSRLLRGTIVALAIGVIAASLLAAYRVLPAAAERLVFQIGGMTTLLCAVALFLLGVVWSVPGRSISSPFIVTLAAVAVTMIGIEASGRLWWRWVEPDIWGRTTDSSGLLQQSSGMTCSPAAAVMLLHQLGIPAGEGEMAYLAGTTLLGTDAHGITRALEAKVGSRGWRVEAGITTYEECMRRGGPFLAHVQGGVLGHAVAVTQITPAGVEIRDPADGTARTLAREEFEWIWDRTAVRVVP